MPNRVLFLDIETSPNIGYTWQKYEQNVIEFEKEWELLSFAYKWLDEEKVYCISRRKFPNEKTLVLFLWRLFDKADVIVAHNGDDFDIKKSRFKFIQYGLKPPSPFSSIDTKKLAKKYFKFNSNSLNDLCKTLSLGQKVETGGFNLWKACMSGHIKSLKQMEEYNKQDIILLEKLYFELRKWVYQQPGISISDNKTECPNCRSIKIWGQGFKTSRSGKKQRYQCQDCGSWFL